MELYKYGIGYTREKENNVSTVGLNTWVMDNKRAMMTQQ